MIRLLGVAAAVLASVGAVVAVNHEPAVLVERVIDGDTLALATGDRVRLIGIDSPEADECGFLEATEALRAMVEGREVALPNPDSVIDTDRYGRLLRYVDLDGADAGYAQLASGMAIARYDSQDGYDPHPREVEYRATDAATLTMCEERDRDEAHRAADRAGLTYDDDADPAALKALAASTWADARDAARNAGLTPRDGETATALHERADRAWVRARSRAESAGITARTTDTAASLRARAQQTWESARSAAASAGISRRPTETAVALQARAERQWAEARRQALAAGIQPWATETAHEVEKRARDVIEQRAREADLADRERAAGEDDRYTVPAPPAPSTGGGSYPGYTGPRCYAPGGQTWTPC